MASSSEFNVNKINRKTWDSLHDTALVAFISHKLEKMLTILLAEFIVIDPTILNHLNQKYNKGNIDDPAKPVGGCIVDDNFNRFKPDTVGYMSVQHGQHLRRLTKSGAYRKDNRDTTVLLLRGFKGLSLGSLQKECFSEYSTVQILRKDKGIFNHSKEVQKLADLRNSMLHYSTREPPLTLEPEERKYIIQGYEYLVKNTHIIKAVSSTPAEKSHMRREYLQVIDVSDYRAILDKYFDLECNLKKSIMIIQLKSQQSAGQEDKLMELQQRYNKLKANFDELFRQHTEMLGNNVSSSLNDREEASTQTDFQEITDNLPEINRSYQVQDASESSTETDAETSSSASQQTEPELTKQQIKRRRQKATKKIQQETAEKADVPTPVAEFDE